jgi:hypothetical protein
MDFETTDQDVNPETSELGHTFSLGKCNEHGRRRRG